MSKSLFNSATGLSEVRAKFMALSAVSGRFPVPISLNKAFKDFENLSNVTELRELFFEKLL